MKFNGRPVVSLSKVFFICLLQSLVSCQDYSVKPVGNDLLFANENNQAGRSIAGHHSDRIQSFYGPAIPIGQGVARGWISVNREGDPVALGVNLSEHALNHLSSNSAEYVLKFPRVTEALPFNHITMHWNPHGHEPSGIYDLPHFDFHFNLISMESRLSIPGMAPPYFDPAPDAKYIPEAYVQTPGVVPTMGVHWVDILSDEFQVGGAFSNTMILGTYDARLIFYEPMVTLQYLQTKPNDTRLIRQPEAFQVSGYYPTSYSVISSESPGEYTISLNDLVFRTAQ